MPVLIISPNGTVTERPSLVVAVQEHVTQPDPHVINVLNKTMIITTSMAQTTTPIQVPAGVELKFANNAVYTIGTGQTLDLSLCEFQKPHYSVSLTMATRSYSPKLDLGHCKTGLSRTSLPLEQPPLQVYSVACRPYSQETSPQGLSQAH